MKKLAKNTELANACFVSPVGEGIFEVASNATQYIVDLKVRSCTCRRWDLSGIPCSHSIACMREDRILLEEMVHSCYSIESFCKAYGNIIVPCRDKKEWQKMNGSPIRAGGSNHMKLIQRKVERRCRRMELSFIVNTVENLDTTKVVIVMLKQACHQ